jgi:hypothetical protein
MSENTWSVMIDYPDEDVQEGDILGVPEAILERLGAQDHIRLKVGSYEREVRCQVIEQENELHIPAHIMHEIGLQPQHTYHLTADTMILRFGPVIGVIVGHFLGVVAAHDRAVALLPKRHQLTGQLPLLLVMVGFTVSGLYLLFSA